MSTILKTLKKLEEEKSVLDQKLGLKGRVLKEEAVYSKVVENEHLRFFPIVAIFLGALIIGGVAFNYWIPTHKVPTPSKRIITKTQTQKIPHSEKLPKPRTFEGISMAGILNSEKETAAKPKQAFAFVKQLATKLPVTESPMSKQPIPSKPLSVLLPKDALLRAASSDYEEIGNLIQSVTTLAKNTPASLVAIRNGYLPDVTVKGIVFFDEGSSFNHIIVTTPSNNNLKLRVGDSVQNAILKSIHPNRVIFLNQEQPIEMSIGQ